MRAGHVPGEVKSICAIRTFVRSHDVLVIGLISSADPNYQNQFERRGEPFFKQNN
jgi:hypothetical protein